MPAYLVNIRWTCDQPSCATTATVELHNTWGARCGRYCTRHGKLRLREALAREAHYGERESGHGLV